MPIDANALQKWAKNRKEEPKKPGQKPGEKPPGGENEPGGEDRGGGDPLVSMINQLKEDHPEAYEAMKSMAEALQNGDDPHDALGDLQDIMEEAMKQGGKDDDAEDDESDDDD